MKNLIRNTMLKLPTRIVQIKKKLIKTRLMPLADNIKILKNGDATLNYKERTLLFKKYDNVDFLGWIEEVFVLESYKWLDVKGKNVIDIGSSMGDTPMYFAVNGAKKVIAYEIEPTRYKVAKENIKYNHLKHKIRLNNRKFEPKELDTLRDGGGRWLLKIDCDGCEYALFKKITDAQLNRFSRIMMEYTFGYGSLVRRLKKAGFKVEFTSKSSQMIYAERK